MRRNVAKKTLRPGDVWSLVTLLLLVILVSYGVHLSIKFFSQGAYNRQTVAKIQEFKIIKIGADRFGVEALYSYKVDGQKYDSFYTFQKPLFLNEFSASDNLKYWDMKEMKVWYKAKKPSQSILQKVFPLKELVYLVVIVSLNLYFFFLRRFTSKRFQNDV